MLLTYDALARSSDRLPGQNGPWGQFAILASDLGWRPGEWRRMIPTTLGNGQPFVLQSVDCESAKYRQQLGQTELTVYSRI